MLCKLTFNLLQGSRASVGPAYCCGGAQNCIHFPAFAKRVGQINNFYWSFLTVWLLRKYRVYILAIKYVDVQIFSVISVVTIGIDPFLDLNGQNSNFENYKFISDPFYIRVNDWLATAEPSMDIFWHFFWVSPGQNGSLFLN